MPFDLTSLLVELCLPCSFDAVALIQAIGPIAVAIDVGERLVEEHFRVLPVFFCQPVAVKDYVINMSGTKKWKSIIAPFCQSLGSICLIVEGGTPAS